MGKKDTLTKEYMADNHIFADAFNYFVYDGEQVIKPERLRELDGTEITVPYGAEDAVVPVQKYRDVLKELTIKRDDSAVYLLLGIENQSHIHYAMPVKNMVYDALQYAGQVDETARKTRNINRRVNQMSMQENYMKVPTLTSGEYLYGFRKEDRLLPVITLVIYFGAEEWDAPMSLHEMFAMDDETILSLVPDYKLNLIAPANMTNDEFDRLTTDLREVLLFIKYSKDKKQLAYVLKQDKGFQSLERKTVQVINVLTNSDIKTEESEGDGKVCIAIDGIRADAREEGRIEGRMDVALSMLKSMRFSYDEISEMTQFPVEELKRLEIEE